MKDVKYWIIVNNIRFMHTAQMSTTTVNSKVDLYNMFSFPLSDWQQLALDTINNGNNCLVTAPTGSGKTLPAEYAIKHFTSLGKKVIYTSPLKALSNQKYNDFRNDFSDISFGILTGDIKDNETADVLIMTTEILCNYLHNYKKTSEQRKVLDFDIDLHNDLGCVVFDEVHYINDLDRGTVWEESIMLMPKNVQMVMLSATIDEPERFSQWVENINPSKTTVICSTTDRAVPLKHYLWFGVSDEMIHKRVQDKNLLSIIGKRANKLNVLSEQGKFADMVYHDIRKIKDDLSYKQIYLKRSFLLNKLVRFLNESEMLPAICFVYSRRLVETLANELTISLLEQQQLQKVESECRHILSKFSNASEYMELPEYAMVVRLLQKGIGVHHAGLIPVLREMVEIMFTKGYVKMLFATETFAVGLNMPTKTVVFTNLRKYTGTGERYLYSHEYTQQAGRAGRRGFDTIGHVIHMANLIALPELSDYKLIMNNKPQKIYSKFKISYSLLLQMQQLNDESSTFDPVDFIKQSIIQSDISKEIAGIEYELSESVKKCEGLERTIKECCKMPREQYENIRELENNISMGLYKNKARKAKQRELDALKSEIRNFEREYGYYTDYGVAMENKCRIQKEKEGCENYIRENVQCVKECLEENNFVNGSTSAMIASQIKETHCLVTSDVLTAYKMFNTFSEREIIGILACFTNMSVASEMRSSVPRCENSNVLEVTKYIDGRMRHYDQYEDDNRFNSGSNYEINFDASDVMMTWCDVENSNDAIVFLKKMKEEQGVFVGEFVKGVLKVTNILKEHEKIFSEMIPELEYVEKIKGCYDLLLKFVCTSQSLYV